MAYDPLAYVPNTGQAIASVGNQFAQMIAQLPGALRQDEAFKRAEAQYRYDNEFNSDVHSTLSDYLKQKGIDVSIREPKEGEGRDAYLQDVASTIVPLVQSGVITSEDAQQLKGLASNEQVQGASQVQNMVNRYESQDPLGQIDMNGYDQAQPATMSNEGAQVPFAPQPAGPSESVPPVPIDREPDPLADGVYDEMRREALAAAKAGMYNPAELYKDMNEIKKLEMKTELERMKEAREEKRRKEEQFRAGVINRSGTNQLVDKEGDPLAALTADNIDEAGIGPRIDKNVNMNYSGLKGKGGGSGGGSGGAESNLPEEYKTFNQILSNLTAKSKMGNVDQKAIDQAMEGSRTTYLAMKLQDKSRDTGVPLPDDRAKSLARKTLQTESGLRDIVNSVEYQSDKHLNLSNAEILSLYEKDLREKLPPDAYASIRRRLLEDKNLTLEQVLQKITSQMSEYHY